MPERNKIAVFLDYDNIWINMRSEPPEKCNDDVGMKRFKDWLSNIGEISLMFAFAPEDTIRIKGKFLYDHGFISVSCPILIDEKQTEKRRENEFERLLRGEPEPEFDPRVSIPTINTTDEIMIKTAKIIIDEMPEITHICIASGDGDFLPIAEMAKVRGKKVMIMISDYKSPSKKLLREANRGPNGKKMIHIFNPIRD